ncbi:TetR/AcrR family transcriptional regulator [Kineococcus sp. SYSU DK005]|uniref:TetR/AcrR family transcriptional regulator n=1 Tax=Kineococcus sp. SYSU DK005 TaxID=3383126 RepID=UPI003D7DBDA1
MPRPRTVSDEDVLAATARALHRHGPASTTLAAVAREAGVSAAALVHRFGSKRELLLAFAARATEDVPAGFATARAAHPQPLRALHAALAELVADVEDREALAHGLAFLQVDVTDEAFRAHAAARAHHLREGIALLLAQAVRDGELRAGTAAADLARCVHLTCEGVLVLWPLTGTAPLREELRTAVDAVLDPHRPSTRETPGGNP